MNGLLNPFHMREKVFEERTHHNFQFITGVLPIQGIVTEGFADIVLGEDDIGGKVGEKVAEEPAVPCTLRDQSS